MSKKLNIWDQVRPYRLMVRTLPFHDNNTGSNPVKDNFSMGM